MAENQKKEKIETFYDNGKLKSEDFSDGTYRNWSIYGKLEEEKYEDGTIKSWYEDGYSSLVQPDGTEFMWYPNGKLCYEKMPDKTEIRWFENGKMSKFVQPDGTKKMWNEEGKPYHGTFAVNYKGLDIVEHLTTYDRGKIIDYHHFDIYRRDDTKSYLEMRHARKKIKQNMIDQEVQQEIPVSISQIRDPKAFSIFTQIKDKIIRRFNEG